MESVFLWSIIGHVYLMLPNVCSLIANTDNFKVDTLLQFICLRYLFLNTWCFWNSLFKREWRRHKGKRKRKRKRLSFHSLIHSLNVKSGASWNFIRVCHMDGKVPTIGVLSYDSYSIHYQETGIGVKVRSSTQELW